MEYYSVLLPLAIILVVSKVLVKFCEKLNLPSVVGMLLAGIIIGLIKFIPSQEIITHTSLSGLGFIAKLGVIFIMFNAGLGIEINEEECLKHPYQPHTLRHYTGALTDIRPAKTEFYF